MNSKNDKYAGELVSPLLKKKKDYPSKLEKYKYSEIVQIAKDKRNPLSAACKKMKKLIDKSTSIIEKIKQKGRDLK